MSISMPTAIEGDRRELTWTKIGGHGVLGSWDDDYVRSIRSAFVHEGQIYVTAFGSKEMGSAAIWKFDGSSWSRIFLAADHRLPFNRFGSVLQIGNQFIVGTGVSHGKGRAAMLVFEPSPDGDDLCYGRPIVPKEQTADNVPCLLSINGGVLFGLGSHFGRPRFPAYYQRDGRRVPLTFDDGAFSMPELQRGTYCMGRDQDAVYLGLCAKAPASSGILRVPLSAFDNPGEGIECDVEAVFDKDYVQSMTLYKGVLHATVNGFAKDLFGNHPIRSSVWKRDAGKWEPLIFEDVPTNFQEATNFNTIRCHGDRLLVSSGTWNRPAEGPIVGIWDVGGSYGSVRQIAGGGIAGSWTENDLLSSAENQFAWIYHITPFGERLITSISFTIGSGQAVIWMGQ